MTTTPSRVEGQDVVALSVPTLAWAVRRTLLAILILVVFVAGAACLFYASIDPDEVAPPAARSPAPVAPAMSTGYRQPPPALPRRV